MRSEKRKAKSEKDRRGPGRAPLLVLGAVLVGLFAFHFSLFAQSPDLAESQRRLEEIRRERERLSGEMSRSQARVRTMTGELQTIEREVGSSTELLDELNVEVSQRDEQVSQTARDLLVTRDRLGDRRAVLHRRLRNIYKRGPLHSVQVLLTAESFGDLINRYKYLFLIARHDRQLVREVAMLENQLVSRERLLERTLAGLRDVQSEGSMVRDQLSDLRAAQERALATARAGQRATAARIAELDRSERSLRALLAGLERARSAPAAPGAARAPTTATLTTRDLGALAWPVQGDLLYRFGRSAQSNGTAIRWNGIGIGAAVGTQVRAVEAGRVVMAGPFEGYGPTVVLSHGGGYYSLYLYLRQTSVREGEMVSRNQAVGTVGGAGTPEGPHLEFQIRGPGGEAVDPLTWLQSRAAQ